MHGSRTGRRENRGKESEMGCNTIKTSVGEAPWQMHFTTRGRVLAAAIGCGGSTRAVMSTLLRIVASPVNV